jgi:hypothetical protein
MSIADAVGVHLAQPPNPASPEQASGIPPGTTRHLLRAILEHHQALGLDDEQMAALSRIHWSTPSPPLSEATDRVARILSAEQFRQCIGFVAAATAPDSGTAATADVSATIKAAIDERIKDKDAVAVELATKAADRLMGWIRTFGFFVAIPVAGFLALLGFFGVTSFQDLREMRTNAEATLRSAQQELSSVTSRSKEVDSQLAKLGAHLDANDQQIEALDHTVRNLAERLTFGHATDLSDVVQNKLKQAAADFLSYFQRLGYVPKTNTVEVSTKVDVPGGLSYYEPSSNTIFVQADLADDETLVLHEYAHRILYSSLSFDALEGNPRWKFSAVPIEFGLADYFVCSALKRPLVGAVAAKKVGAAASDEWIPDKLENSERITATRLGSAFDSRLAHKLGLAWGGAFWELRQALGQSIVDKALYEAWRGLGDQDPATVVHSFVKSVAAQLEAAAGKPAVKQWRDILARRGLGNAELPSPG